MNEWFYEIDTKESELVIKRMVREPEIMKLLSKRAALRRQVIEVEKESKKHPKKVFHWRIVRAVRSATRRLLQSAFSWL